MSNSFPSLDRTPGAFPLPSISEDTLDYALHMLSSSSSDPYALTTLITQHVEGLLVQPWLWNKDGWELKVARSSSSPSAQLSSGGQGSQRGGLEGSNGSEEAVLEGRMRVGDAVDDEWLVVWLLREVSKQWPELVISIRDTDGEFLLIEAANDLPAWVSPDNANNRLWLMNGHLHLLPLSLRSSTSGIPRSIPDDEIEERTFDPESYISEEDAVRAVRTGKYRAEERMEGAVWARIAHYPGVLKGHLHRTKAYLPINIAKALSKSPELIQRAVEGFYVRDPAQLRAASKMTHFPPSPSILTSVLMTRPAYAQLQGQVFHPPRVFGPEWHVRQGKELDDERRWRDLGVKIATGFEIMYREGGKKGRSGDGNVDEETIKADPAYTKYIADLKSAGFFGTELEGSEKWKAREIESLRGWKSARIADAAQHRPSFAFTTDSAIKEVPDADVSALEVRPSDPEDSDSWLEVSPDELDGLMMKVSGQAPKSDAEQAGDQHRQRQAELGEEHGKALGDLAKKVQEFVGGEGDIQGARFADELSDEDFDDEDDEEEEEEEMSAEQKAERMANIVPALPVEEWGRRSKPKQQPKSDVDMENGAAAAASSRAKIEAVPTPSSRSVVDQIPSKIRPPRFAKQEYDGVISESDSDDEDEVLPPPGTLGRRIAEMKWGEGEERGARIEEIEEDEDEAMEKESRKEKLGWEDDFDEKMRQRVWGEDSGTTGPGSGSGSGQGALFRGKISEETEGTGQTEDAEETEDVEMQEEMDPDMEEEFEGFLKFSREALGINDEMWNTIIKSRESRGAFVPKPSLGKKESEVIPGPGKGKPKVSFAEPSNSTAAAKGQGGAAGKSFPEPQRGGEEFNADLNSFDKVMAAMEAELEKARPGSTAKFTASQPTSSGPSLSAGAGASVRTNRKGQKLTSSANPLPPLPTEADLEEMDEEDLLAMDRELRAALKGAGIEDSDDEMDPELGEDGDGMDVPEARGLRGDDKREYAMMRDFLESYRSQAGQSGVVGNLFGRLGQEGK